MFQTCMSLLIYHLLHVPLIIFSYDGEVVHPDTLVDAERQKAFDLGAWIGRNSREKRWPQVKACAQALKAQYPKVAAIGYCWGGWACFQLGRDPALIDAISTAHPALLEKADFDIVKVPVQLLAPQHDDTYTPELKQYSFNALPRTGVQWEYVYFAGHKHGFASRGEPSDGSKQPGLERAKRCAVNFFNEYLH
jgi:dienelactone hydrolase